ncbi:UDP-N-acetylmuramate--alanine ligase [Limnobacter litoralis]|uniref:UDP-N-acetylmuramate--alanine ligase n=1 Tax=Limnobacter litoralis TaxID=481366 RepID=UPI0024E0C86C|nr:UDP-N-acetylmuramate--alanine ligase [Limnobacter litoralis]
MDEFFEAHDDLRTEIAMTAARLIAEDGYDYPSAKAKAIKQLAGKSRLPKDRIPSDQEIQDELRAYQALYLSDTQPAQLQSLRTVALEFMAQIPEFEPIIYGAVVNGTASDHSDIHLIVFSDDPKEIDYWLFNHNLQAEPCDDALLAGKTYPAVAFQWKRRWFKLGVATPTHRRGLLNRNNQDEFTFQTDRNGLQALFDTYNPPAGLST